MRNHHSGPRICSSRWKHAINESASRVGTSGWRRNDRARPGLTPMTLLRRAQGHNGREVGRIFRVNAATEPGRGRPMTKDRASNLDRLVADIVLDCTSLRCFAYNGRPDEMLATIALQRTQAKNSEGQCLTSWSGTAAASIYKRDFVQIKAKPKSARNFGREIFLLLSPG